MSETTNYQLYLTDSNQEKFLDWRTKMNGPTDSNMTKIDKALAEKADKSRQVQAVLQADAWSGSAVPFTQEVAVDGLTADSNGSANVSMDATAEEFAAAQVAELRVISQSDGVLTITANITRPTVNIPITVTILG